MEKVNLTSLMMIFLVLNSGCLGALEDVSEAIEQTIDALDGDYPQLELPERTRL